MNELVEWMIIGETEEGCYVKMLDHEVWTRDVKSAHIIVDAHNAVVKTVRAVDDREWTDAEKLLAMQNLERVSRTLG